MSQEMVELLIKLVLTILGIIFTTYIVPMLKSNMETAKFEKLQAYIEYAVRYAEQMYNDNQSKEKKKYVYDYILVKSNELGLQMSEKDLDILVEGIVNFVKHD